jgi:hypothetical protein
MDEEHCMAKGLSPAGKKAIFRFSVLTLAALALQGAYPLLFLLEGDGAVLLMVLLTYVLLPAAALLLPCWAALGGAHPMAACLPVGGFSLLVGVAPAWVGLLCLLLALIGAVAGQEWQKRKKG